MHTNAAFNMTEYSTINHVNDSERHLDGFECRFVHLEEQMKDGIMGKRALLILSYLILGS